MTTNGFHTPNLNTNLEEKSKHSIEILKKLFTDYEPNECFISFNGGKDCTVLLHMVINIFKSVDLPSDKIRCIYVQPQEPFPEVEEFIVLCEKEYNIEIEKHPGNIKKVVEKLCKENPQLKACIMGNRRTDPYCQNLDFLQMTDQGWPKLLRVNPILEWTIQNVWDYLFKHKVSYCNLYDLGYTSLGDKTNTVPNPHLKLIDSEAGIIKYKRAFELTNDALERAGRT